MDIAFGPRARPVVGIPASVIVPERLPVHMASAKYVDVVTQALGAIPFILPSIGDRYDFAELLSHLDGILLTGGRANIEPHHYEGPTHPPGEIRDPSRDSTVLPLIRAAVDKGVPVLGVCRGIQEINVALGGSLHYRVHQVEGKNDHRMTPGDPIEKVFGPRHRVDLTPGGLLEGRLGTSQVLVNSLHGQGIDQLAPSLVVEAVADDGLIEAVRLRIQSTYVLGVQWHAEWNFDQDPVSRAVFGSFSEAVAERALKRRTGARQTA
jgi:putative glutamine amidotransferase